MGDAARDATGIDCFRPGARIVLASIAMPVLFGIILFVAAWRLDWLVGWLHLFFICFHTAASYAYLSRHNPTLLVKRSRIGKGTKHWDIIWLGAFTPLTVAVYVVAALDGGRYGWSEMSLLYSWPIGCAAFVAGGFVITWAMAENPFFEKTVRIQSEYGHRVIDSGPYRHVRHPGYSGVIGWFISAPLMLGSWWAFIPAVLTVIALVIRTSLEDRTLAEELPGYKEYAARVRFKLIPMAW